MDEMNQALAMADAELSPIRKKPNTTLIYLIDESTYLKLCDLFYMGIELAEMKTRHFLMTSTNGAGENKRIFGCDEETERLINDYIKSIDPDFENLIRDEEDTIQIECDTYEMLCSKLDVSGHTV